MADQLRPFPAGAGALGRLRPVLITLLEAYDYAQDSQTDPVQFAIDLDSLRPLGLTVSDLRWLLARDLARLVEETTLPGAMVRTFLPLPFTSVTPRCCLALTAAGADALRQCCAEPAAEPRKWQHESDVAEAAPEPLVERDVAYRSQWVAERTVPAGGESPRPKWDADLRELTFRGKLVKRYKVPAANQELVLSVFEEEGWPDWIDDPLPPTPDIDSKRRLQATIKSLNRCQIVPLIAFHCNGNGHKVVWSERRD